MTSRKREGCDMRGMLTFQILWLLSKRPMYGQELAGELERRRGERPNPGTIYPPLKHLEELGWIKARQVDHNKVYELTELGAANLHESLIWFKKAFGEIFSTPVSKKINE
ncbi:MAG: PadR family transcriptional regulator [Thermoprotei archaeon]